MLAMLPSAAVSQSPLGHTVDESDLIPDWFNTYRLHKHHSKHFIDKYLVMTLRFRIAIDTCKGQDMSCFDKAYKIWEPALEYARRAMKHAIGMSAIVYAHCIDNESVGICVTMIKDEKHLIKSHGGYDLWAIKIYKEARKLEKLHNDIMNGKKKNKKPAGKGIGLGI